MCALLIIVGVNQIATRLKLTWSTSLVGDVTGLLILVYLPILVL